MQVITVNMFELYAVSDAERFPCAYPEGEQGRPSTLYWADFSVAEKFGVKALKDTWAKVGDIKELDPAVLTELIVVLNHKLWQCHDLGQMETEKYKLYEKWYNKAMDHAVSTNNGWTDAQREHFFYVTD